MLVMLATTPTSATPRHSELAGLAAVDKLRSIVEVQNACALPGCSIKYNSFMSTMWRAVQRGFVAHYDATFIAEGLRHGFSLGVDVTKMRGHRRFSNYKSAIDAAASVAKAVRARVEAGKTLDLGGWTPTLDEALRAMYESTAIFPMGAVAKSVVEYDDEKRPTDDHSRTGLNAATSMLGLRYSLDTYNEIAWYLKQGFFMRVSDVAAAFPLLPLNPSIWPFFLFRFAAAVGDSSLHLYMHVFADFGAAGTPGTFKKFFVDVVVNMARSELVLTLPISIFVDDCGLIGYDQLQVDSEMLAFHTFCKVVCGVFFKFLKDRVAAQKQLMIGFWWDSTTLTRTLEETKLLSYMTTLADYATRGTLTLKEMQSVAGKMQRACMTFPVGAACLVMSMFALTVGLKLPWHRRRVTKTARRDMWTVWELLQLNLGQGYYAFTTFLWGPEVATDASRSSSYTGGGFITRDGVYDFWRYGSRASRKLIDFLEGDTVVETVQRMASRWRGYMVKFYIDNMVFEKSGEKGRSKVERLNVLLKELFMAQILYGFVIVWEWIDTHFNRLADHLSRGREDDFLRDAYGDGWWNLPVGVVPMRLEGAGRTRQLPEVRGQIAKGTLHQASQTMGSTPVQPTIDPPGAAEPEGDSNPPHSQGATRAKQGRGGGVRVRRGGSMLLGLVFLGLCAMGESVRAEAVRARPYENSGVSYVPSSVFDGLPDEMCEVVERIIDNRLAPSSWRKVEAALNKWRPFAREQGWPTIIRSGDPLRGGKLAGFVTMLVVSTALVYASITKYVWGLCEWMKLQHQDDPRCGVRGWDQFMASIKVLTFRPCKPHERFPIELVARMLRAIDKSSFAEVQLGFLLLLLLFTFSRSENPLSKSKEGRECWHPDEHFTWGDIKFVRDRTSNQRRVMRVRFKKIKQDARVERPEASGSGDWATVGSVDDPLFDICTWYILLCSFYPPPLRREDEPFFLDPRRFHDGTRGAAPVMRDAQDAWTYSQAQAASYALQRRVGVAAGEEFGFHGLRVEGYNLSKKGNGEDLTVAHGLWKSSSHKRYDRFGLQQVIDIPRRMLRMRDDVEASEESADESSAESDSASEQPSEREAAPPRTRLLREHLVHPGGAGASSSATEQAGGTALLPAGWWTERRVPASGNAYSVHHGPDGQRASTRPQAWRMSDAASRAEDLAVSPVAVTPSGPVPRRGSPTDVPPLQFAVGMRVSGLFNVQCAKGKTRKSQASWDPGTIQKVHEDGTFDVLYDDGFTETAVEFGDNLVPYHQRPSTRRAPSARNR